MPSAPPSAAGGESNDAAVEAQCRLARPIERAPEHARPACGDALRLAHGDGDAGQMTRRAACDLPGPAGAAPAPGAERIGAVERDDRATDVGRMQVRAGDVGQVDPPDDANPVLCNARASCLELVEVEDHHVAAGAVAREIARGGRVGTLRRDHLDEAVADRKDGIDDAELGDARVAIGLAEAERLTQFALERI